MAGAAGCRYRRDSKRRRCAGQRQTRRSLWGNQQRTPITNSLTDEHSTGGQFTGERSTSGHFTGEHFTGEHFGHRTYLTRTNPIKQRLCVHAGHLFHHS